MDKKSAVLNERRKKNGGIDANHPIKIIEKEKIRCLNDIFAEFEIEYISKLIAFDDKFY